MNSIIVDKELAELSKARSWCELSRKNLRHNLTEINKSLPSQVRKIAVIKADAYGHGQEFVAREAQEAGFSYLAVATVGEAIELRNAGIRLPILLLSPYHQGFLHFLLDYQITQTISSDFEIEVLEKDLDDLGPTQNTSRTNLPVKVHLKIDSGMNRIGFRSGDQEYQESVASICALANHPGIFAEGIFTHFAVADEPELEFTRTQFNRFQRVIDALKAAGVSFEIRHCSNSAASLFFKDMSLDAVRIGISMYGCCPNSSLKQQLDLKPVMSFYSRISAIHQGLKGEKVGYGLTYECPQNMIIATIEAGYADGLDRHLSSNAYALILGQKAPLIGRICMDRTMLDVSAIDGVKVGDRALIFGMDQEGNVIDTDILAERAGTISYDLLCGVSKRIPRVILEDV